MIKGYDIICISSIDWDFIWQGHQEIMSTFARNSNRVLFIENMGVRAARLRDIPRLKKRIKNYFRGIKGIRKEMDNLYIFSPIVLPFPYSRIARWVNKFLLLSILEKWTKAMNFADPIIWTFLPTGTALDIINNINKKIIVYYCIDNFYVSSHFTKKIERTEKKLLKISDLVFVTSKALYDYCIQYRNKVNLFPFGVNIINFEKIRLANTKPPQELQNINKPIVGYVGGIHKWIDQSLINFLAKRYTNYSFVFIGPLQTNISLLRNIENIYFIGDKKHTELPNFIKFFSLTIIPYLITDYTRNVYPTKLNEYLSMGKPIVSTALPEILIFNQRYRNIVCVGKNLEEFGECIDKAIKEDNDALRKRRLEVAQENSWSNRIEEMSNLVWETVERKKYANDVRWKENLLIFFHFSHRRLLRLVGIFILGYYLLFYTPFIWTLAKPLKIIQTPRKADAIVVFAGGAGESGKAGQSYEERVKYAVELYKKECANKIIFSSGYMYAFKEPIVMKALAVSLGVPEERIILEDKAKNTYENAKFTMEILNKEGYNKILLVSSPYHMRRVSLVFNRVTKNIKIFYTPIPNSLFYSHAERGIRSKRINLQQIKGIMHEYLGILYYWWKGWI